MQTTQFSTVYNTFLSMITDDMYMELKPSDTEKLLKEILLNSLHNFEFPRVNIYDYDEDTEEFNVGLSTEEINIIALYMIVEWIGQQLATTELIRMQYSGSDFKMTSQANHMAKLQTLKQDYTKRAFHAQRLYKRRLADKNGIMQSTIESIMQTSPRREYANQIWRND